MSKKSNTVWFMIGATILNVAIMLVLFVICFLLITRFVDPSSSLVPLWLGLSFLVSIGGSFYLYSLVIKWMNKKFRLEDKMAPLMTRHKKPNRHED
jgi:membrane protein implicated in regulation of membrane protease activity